MAGNRRLVLGLACGASALILTLGASGTLSSWSSAIITNSNNSVSTGQAVILSEASGSNTCTSSSSASNSSTCTTINKYGGVTLVPGGSTTVTVTFTNTGLKDGANFQLAPSASCTSTYTSTIGSETAGTASAPNLCSNGDLKVGVACNTGSTFGSGTAWAASFPIAATNPAALAGSGPYNHVATGGDLNSGATWTCQFAVTLLSTAGFVDQNITVSQPITWTLT
ncbi:MAG TPA: hypothetical protein VN108_04715 [Marmoricola sp.]|nr:hypothetical protein [Marmoricola sp.]